MKNPERKALIRFVLLFVTLNSLFLILTSWMYYSYQKNTFIDMRQDSMIHYAETLQNNIMNVHSLPELQEYIVPNSRIEVAFLDRHKKVLYSTFHIPVFLFHLGYTHHKGNYFYVDTIKLDHLKKIHYFILRTNGIEEQLEETRQSIFLFLLFAIFFMAIAIYLLGKLFLQPVQHTIEKLDHFIRDTTHELNTPLSVITMSIEQLNTLPLDPIQSKHIQRINIASRTISNLYNDLAFLMMYEHSNNQDIAIELLPFIEERIDYFRPLAESKKITLHLNLHPSILVMDREKLTRIVDNLLSNAIKYNKPFGDIRITVTPHALRIEDTGIGIPKERFKEIFNRYSRFDEANGGFGIGLNIIQLICNEYHFTIDVDSRVGEGTIFTIFWQKTSH